MTKKRTMRWQEMKTEFSVSGDRTQVKATSVA